MTTKTVKQEVDEWRSSFGTSFFLNFEPYFYLHKLRGDYGESLREKIAQSLRQRFIDVLTEVLAHFPYKPSPIEQFEETLRVEISGPELGFNNGEIYLWLPGIQLKEELIFTILKKLRDSIKEESPINIDYVGKEDEVQFYGWGFRCYH